MKTPDLPHVIAMKMPDLLSVIARPLAAVAIRSPKPSPSGEGAQCAHWADVGS